MRRSCNGKVDFSSMGLNFICKHKKILIFNDKKQISYLAQHRKFCLELFFVTRYIFAGKSFGFGKVELGKGHGEDELPSNLVSSFENENISLTQLNLLTEENIPPDCAALLLYSPASDLSQEEIDKIEAYLAENGSLMLFTDCDAEDLPRLHAMMAKRGVEAVDGMVVEGDSSYFMSNYPNYLIPQLENHEITEPLISGNYYVLMPMTQGLKITAQTDETEQAEADETDASLSVTALLSTTADAYSKIKGLQATDAEKEDGAMTARLMPCRRTRMPIGSGRRIRNFRSARRRSAIWNTRWLILPRRGRWRT